jgi:hypothetical protein
MPTNHIWKFFRAGGFDQVKLETGADLVNLGQLDQKLWVALACPTTGLEFCPRTLALMDTDKDGRIRAPELLAAIQWAAARLKTPDTLVQRPHPLPLNAIGDSSPEGLAVLTSARQILTNLGKGDAAGISVEDLADAAKIFANTVFNGDGVIIAESAGADAATAAVIADLIGTLGSVPDRSGKPGVNQAKVDAFFAAATAFEAWVKKSEADAATVLPLGAGTAAASAALKAVKTKVDDYFGRARLAAFDPRAGALLNRKEEEYLAVAAKDLSISAAEIAAFPLAQVAAGKPLPLRTGLNPAHADAVAAFVTAAVKPVLGDVAELTEANWAALQAKLAPYDAWAGAKAGAEVEKLGVARVREILAGPAQAKLADLLKQDLALEPEAKAIGDVERLVRYAHNLHLLCINFVNFRDLYDGGQPATFQAGTLYLDQRSCTLCIPVEDAGKHAAMAGLAGAYLAYLDCVRKGTGEKLSLVAIFSQGDDDNLMVGRNGLFYDRKGKDYDATITKIIANPISLRQAFWLPYKKFVRMIEEQVTKRAAAADAEATGKLTAAAAATANADKTAAAAAATPPPEKKKVDVGTVAALGVAFGAIGGFFTAIATGLTSVIGSYGPLVILVLLAGVIALISGPSMILAFIKLRKRNLGPILDANGWAVNAAAKINVPFGTSLTGIASLPPGSQRDLVDPFAEKKSPWPRLLGLLVLLYLAYLFCDRGGYIHNWTGGRFGTAKVAPAKAETKTDSATDAVKTAEPAK